VSHDVNSGAINERLSVLLRVAPRFADLHLAVAADADSLEGGCIAARALLTGHGGITALLCANDWMAMGALRALRESGLRVPGDISVTGFDNVDVAQFCVPALTSVHIARDRIGQAICDYLMNPATLSPRDGFAIDPEVLVRGSTGPAATGRY